MTPSELRVLIRERARLGVIGHHDGTLNRGGKWTWEPATQRQQERNGSWLYDKYLSPAQLEKQLSQCRYRPEWYDCQECAPIWEALQCKA